MDMRKLNGSNLNSEKYGAMATLPRMKVRWFKPYTQKSGLV